ncbi:MAG: hypothetical protein EPN82_16465 [Bacteroidetes bacterium]|nr:MAG: hypothetical protein EPN82_16465 [Bacteroidota bacterium]
MNIKKFTASYTVIAEDKDEAWTRIDEVVLSTMKDESTLSNTFSISEEELTEAEIKLAKMMKTMIELDR